MSARELLEECKKALIATRTTDISIKHQALIDQIDAELAKPEPEPIGFINPLHLENSFYSARVWKERGCNGIYTPLYAEPPQRKPLSDDEIIEIFKKIWNPLPFARAIEKATGLSNE